MNSSRFLKILFGLVAIVCFLYVGRNYFDELPRILEASLWGIAGIVVVHLLTLWLQSLTLKWGLDAFDRSITEREGFALFVISSYANLLLPRSGVGTTAVYLNRARKISMVDYGSVVGVNAVLFVLACSVVSCFVFAADWYVQGTPPPLALVIAIPAFLIASWLAIRIDWRFLDRYKGPGNGLLKKLSHARVRLGNSKQIYRIGGAHLILVFLRALRLYIAFWAMGYEVSYFAVLLTSVLGDLAFVIAVTPNALGFRETAIAIAAVRLGIPVPAALSVAILDRLVFSGAVVVAAQAVLGFGFARSGQLAESSQSKTVGNGVSQTDG